MPRRSRKPLVPFGRRLRALRARHSLSMRDVARWIGVDFTTVSMWEHAYQAPTPATLEHLADLFGVTMDELWRGIGRCEGLGDGGG